MYKKKQLSFYFVCHSFNTYMTFQSEEQQANRKVSKRCGVLLSRANRPAVGVRYDPYPVTVATVTVPRRTEPGTYDTYAGAVAAGTSHASVTSYAAAAPPAAVAATADPYQLQPIAAAFPRVQPAANSTDSFARDLLELYSANPAAFTTFAARSPLMRQSATGLGSGAVPMAVGVTELSTSSYTLAPARTDYFEKRLGPGFVIYVIALLALLQIVGS